MDRRSSNDTRPRRPDAIEWRTILLAVAIHAGWLAITWWHAVLPTWLLVIGGGWFVAWHGSLQHETIHGHPTRSALFNVAIGSLPLSLWLPYRCYRRDHLAHHAADAITDPRVDPESRYLCPADGRRHAIVRAMARAQATLAGRLILGPPIGIAGFLSGEARRGSTAPLATLRDWVPHLIGVALVMAWLSACHLGIGVYLIAFVYPGAALTLLRSFAEHRAADAPDHRVAIVERAGPFALLFLNNNLHAVHHDAPGLPWYAMPARYRRDRASILRANGGLLYRGYGEIVRRYGLRAHDRLIHPSFRSSAAT